jgi:hypothetical protein
MVLGRFVDTGRWLPPALAVSAAAEALARSAGEFLDLADAWSGRYLVLYGDVSSRRVTTDATGMRSAFYALDGPFVLATHARLVADIVGAGASPIEDAYRAVRLALSSKGPLPMPGRSTPWDGVVALTANMALEVPGRRLDRIFPRHAQPTLDAPSAASVIGPRLRGQFEALVATGKPVALSVTAGRDSRVSLAASRTWREAITYFTYGPEGHDDWDVWVARRISSEHGLSHRVLEYPSTPIEPDLQVALDEATTTSHNRQLVPVYRRAFSADTIHIRSNVGEVGRCFYRRLPWGAAVAGSGSALTPESIVRLWAPKVPVAPVVTEAFDDWMQAVGFADIEGMDPFDVLYWEHRMACWHANLLLESDFAFETHVLFNARDILRDMLAVPSEDRASSRLFELLVADLWPELARWPYTRPAKPISQSSSGSGALRRRVSRLLQRSE